MMTVLKLLPALGLGPINASWILTCAERPLGRRSALGEQDLLSLGLED